MKVRYCKNCQQETEHYKSGNCKPCTQDQVKAKTNCNIANGKCFGHKDRSLDPRSRSMCTPCFEDNRVRAIQRRARAAAGGCEVSGCTNPNAGGIHCTYHREVHRKYVLTNGAIKQGIRWIKDIPPTMLLEFQDGRCFLCGMTSNGRALHRDHRHQSNGNVGWLRGYLCHGCNTKLRGHLDADVAATLRYFKEHKLDDYNFNKLEEYLTNSPYFQLLEKLGYARPGDDETPDEYYQRFPKQQLTSKPNRGRIYTWATASGSQLPSTLGTSLATD